jgi:hypothetical protein
MRASLALSSLPAAVLALAWACANTNDNPAVKVTEDASSADGDDAAGESGAVADSGGLPDSLQDPCTLGDHVTDPVDLCLQQEALSSEVKYAYTMGQGVAPSWSSVTGAPGSGHSWQDDLGLAGALGAYYCSAEVYGNTQVDAPFKAVVVDLAAVLGAELSATPPSGYDGEVYFRMRWAQAAFAYWSGSGAIAMQAAADAFAAGLLSQAYPRPPVAGGDGGDAGAGGIVIGSKNADGTVAYSPARSVMAAAALLDWAGQAAANDGGSRAQAWATAQEVLDYVLARGKDPVTGLFYQSLVTSSDPGHDALGPAAPTNDTFLTDDQAWVVLGLVRAQDALAKSAGGDAGGGSPIYANAASDLASAVVQANLFDGTTSPGTPPPPGAFMEGVGPAGVLTNKTTIGNAMMLGGLHRTLMDVGVTLAYTLGEMRAALTQAQPAHSSLFSVVTDPSGLPAQQAFLRASSKSFDYAVTYADAGAAVEEPGARDYRADAVHALVEGLSQLWHGAANNPNCAP